MGAGGTVALGAGAVQGQQSPSLLPWGTHSPCRPLRRVPTTSLP